MFGWIMPEPLQKPPTWTVTVEPSACGTSPLKETSFGWVSVVMTASAASWAASGECLRPATAAGTPFS